LEKIENGERPPSQRVLEQITVSFGLTAESMSWPHGNPRSVLPHLKQGDIEHLVKKWQWVADGILRSTEETLKDFMFPKLLALFKAALRENDVMKVRYHHALTLMIRISEWIDKMVEEFHLEFRLKAVLDEAAASGKPVKWRSRRSVSSGGVEHFTIPSIGNFGENFVLQSPKEKKASAKRRKKN
jgi:hypothetical protein